NIELAVALLGVEFPNLFAVKIKATKIARADEGIDMFAIRAGGGRSAVAFVTPDNAVADAQFALPLHFPLGANAQQDQVIAVLASEEDALAPNGGRGASHARQRQFPGDVLSRTPPGREVCFLADAVVGGAAPLGPVFCGGAPAERQDKETCGKETTAEYAGVL